MDINWLFWRKPKPRPLLDEFQHAIAKAVIRLHLGHPGYEETLKEVVQIKIKLLRKLNGA